MRGIRCYNCDTVTSLPEPRYRYLSRSGNGNLHTVAEWMNSQTVMFGSEGWEFVAFDGSGGSFTVIVRKEIGT